MGNKSCSNISICATEHAPNDILNQNLEIIPENYPNYNKNYPDYQSSPDDSPFEKSRKSQVTCLPTPLLPQSMNNSDFEEAVNIDTRYCVKALQEEQNCMKKFERQTFKEKEVKISSVTSVNSDAGEALITIQGEIFKYTGGSKVSFTSRWGVVQDRQFVYYRNQLSAWRLERPLQVLDIDTIDIVRKQSDLREIKSDLFLFELVVVRKIRHQVSFDGSQKSQFYSTGSTMAENKGVQTVQATPRKMQNRSWNKCRTPVRSQQQTLTQRINSMNTAKSRLIFGVKDKEEYKAWLKVLANILNKQDQNAQTQKFNK